MPAIKQMSHHITRRFHTIFRQLTLLLVLVGSAQVTQAEVTSNAEDRFYVISPRSPYDIRNELRRMTPLRERRGSFNGRTDWKIDWRYETTGDASGCNIHDVRVNINIVTTLPALSQYVTEPQTIKAFERFRDALVAHERNHGKNGLAAAEEIDAALSSIPTQHDCNAVSRLAEQYSQSIINKYVQKDREYDYRTRNGMTEGAIIY